MRCDQVGVGPLGTCEIRAALTPRCSRVLVARHQLKIAIGTSIEGKWNAKFIAAAGIHPREEASRFPELLVSDRNKSDRLINMSVRSQR